MGRWPRGEYKGAQSLSAKEKSTCFSTRLQKGMKREVVIDHVIFPGELAEVFVLDLRHERFLREREVQHHYTRKIPII